MQLVKTAMVTGKRTVLLFAPQTPLVALETSARATLGERVLIGCHRFVDLKPFKGKGAGLRQPTNGPEQDAMCCRKMPHARKGRSGIYESALFARWRGCQQCGHLL